jgi:hypothetical protein
MADLIGRRTMNVEKVRNLLMQAVLDLKDAKASKEITPHRRFVAAYEVVLHCGLAVLEIRRIETKGEGHHLETLTQLVEVLGLKGSAAAEVRAMCQARNDVTYKGRMQIADEALVLRTIQWAERILNETEGWVRKNQPNVFGG